VDAVLLGEPWVLLDELWVPLAEVCRSVAWSGSLRAACGEEARTWARAEPARGPPDPQPMARIAAQHRHPA
jgi:hypothetical protein